MKINTNVEESKRIPRSPIFSYGVFDDCLTDKQSSMLSQFYENSTKDFCKQDMYFSCDSKIHETHIC